MSRKLGPKIHTIRARYIWGSGVPILVPFWGSRPVFKILYDYNTGTQKHSSPIIDNMFFWVHIFEITLVQS